MARIRTIKPDFFKSERIDAFKSDTVRLLFVGLWTYVDDYGRGRDDARLVRAEIFPLRDDMTTGEVEKMLVELTEHGVIARYSVGGKRYLHVTNWDEHQRVSRPTESKFPPPEDGEETPSDLDSCDTIESSMKNIEFSMVHIEPSCQEKEMEQGKGTGKREKEVDPPGEALRLSNLLADLIEENGALRPKVTEAWWQSVDRMMRIDKRTPEQIERAMRWSQAHEFWRSNILSPRKLREKYETLRLQAQTSNRANGSGLSTIERMYNEALQEEENATL